MELQKQQETGASYRRKVLIVDDSPVTLAALSQILSDDHYHLVQATNGREALDRAHSEHPDLILMDVMMPELNGFEAARILKEDCRTHNIPIIMVTALDDAENKSAGQEAGADEYLTKPVRPQELVARVNSLLVLKQYRDQLDIRNHSQWSFIIDKDSHDSLTEPQKELPRVLLVEDNETDAQLVQHFLNDLPLRFERVAKGKEALRLAQSGKVDLMLLDLLLPDLSGFEVCRRIRSMEKGRGVPIVVITCLDDMDSKVKSIELETDDFLIKPIVGRELQARVRVLLEKKRQLDHLRSHYEKALSSAVVDWLTGLYNHGYFKKFLDLEIKKSLRQRYPIALIMIDIDNFKSYNDTYGHPVGDVILQELGQVLRKSVREVDLVARYGGDEFAVVLPYSDGEGGLRVAQRIDQAIRSCDFSTKGLARGTRLTVSMGVACYPRDGFHVDALIQSADQKLYEAKVKGKDQISA
ncbi:MAG: diguanylate cyclase [Candidatus Aminicenantes bacterium]|nr:diguanylate cyclase [Candidatus Aminicenantes bacterium]